MLALSPSWPWLPLPQQYAAPLAVNPQECAFPAVTLLNASPPAMLMGALRLEVVPSPSWPPRLAPQQYAAPAAVTPQVWSRSAPALTAVKARWFAGPVGAPSPWQAAIANAATAAATLQTSGEAASGVLRKWSRKRIDIRIDIMDTLESPYASRQSGPPVIAAGEWLAAAADFHAKESS
ncbi:MAG TPA: hypothetical protein VHE78_16770 [Gemmatimonadaceae bacterium]|nr:hypothetical protein [Gemmatimonadaceae bacterium]